jgi:hypothetical protein
MLQAVLNACTGYLEYPFPANEGIRNMHAILQCEDAHRTFSTLTRFWRTFSTMTVESFHDDGRHFRLFMLILFHAYNRPHNLCAVRHNFRKTQKSALILEKRHAVMPPGFALQAVGMVLQANIDFLKIGWIEVTFLKIARIFLNQNMPRRDLVRKYM